MRIKRQSMRFAAGLAVVALVAGACGSDDDDNGDDGGDDAAATTEAAGDDTADEGDDTADEGDVDMAAVECETANNEANSVASLPELDFSGLEFNVGS